jgi:hypothetical protein
MDMSLAETRNEPRGCMPVASELQLPKGSCLDIYEFAGHGDKESAISSLPSEWSTSWRHPSGTSSVREEHVI